MWVIEINIAGFRFTHRVHDRRRPVLRLRPLGWRPAPLPRTPAA